MVTARRVLTAGLVCVWAGAAAGAGLRLHVPSPDWRDQVIYFVVTDRFADGDPRNNDQGAGEFVPGDKERWQGGDLAGLRQRLDYIRGLGATALWITPPVANQWLDASGRHGGYHGYWAENFMQVDRHLGSLDDYRLLSHDLHSAGMYLVQDIVVNHVGNYFAYGPAWSATDPAAGYLPYVGTPPVARPSQSPFDRNDPRDAAQARAGIYHWTPDITDYGVSRQAFNFQMSGLDDLNTEHPAVRRALRQSYAHWIREVGVDAYRVDTAFYVPPDYFADLLHSTDAAAPGLAEVARRTGRRQFHVFGEGFGIDRPGQDGQTRKIDRYMRTPQGRSLLPGMLNFPLYGALGDVFARGRPPAELAERITKMMRLHARPHLMPSFIDNHDVDRFLAGGSVAALQQALLAMFTLPGIPVIYYGTEQGFVEPRASMFASGFGSGGRDRYDTQAPLYRAIAAMAALRREQPLFSRGTPRMLAANAARPGAIAWRMDHGAARALVVINTADAESLLPALATGLPAGTVLEGLHGLAGRPDELVVGSGGRVSLRLGPRSGQVWRVTERRAALPRSAGVLTLDALADAQLKGDFVVAGRARGVGELWLVVDGDLAGARRVQAGADGRWQATVATGDMVDPVLTHTVTAWTESGAASPSRSFRIRRAWELRADAADPAGDDRGPDGAYVYPTDPGWGVHRQMDLRRVRVATAGGAMRLQITTHAITAPWNPPLGFDHVAFTVYIELPGQPGGATVMPLQNASLPGGMRWHRRLRVGGWTSALFSAAGASAVSEGTPVAPAAQVSVDRAGHTVTLTLPAGSLGSLSSLSGARIYVTTWDYDGGYRSLGAEPSAFAIGGGRPDGAKVMDDSAVIVLP